MRKSGVLLSISSLPSKYGIGCFSKEAYEFTDWLFRAGQSYWQLLPLGPTSYGDSPYQSFSAYAGNPYFIDLETLIEEGFLSREDCEACDFGDNEEYVDYEKLYKSRFKILKKAYKKSHIGSQAEFKEFVENNKTWLKDYALYMVIKGLFDNKCWIEWNQDIKLRKPQALLKYEKENAEEVEFYEFIQYEFFNQWKALKAYANAKKIQFIGDIPIYVSIDSADAWANPQLFQFDENCCPTAVAGCPPDAFSATGQLWGNPLYKWEYHKETGYKWWIDRMKNCFELVDMVRIDHFRGFDEYYAIPYGDKTAEFGKWLPGPGYEIFDTIKKSLGKREVIAEDLGFLTPSVLKLVKKTGYPGMKILQFAFDSREESDYLPHNYTRGCVVYTGTHDNDTIKGWYQNLNRHDKNFCKRYMDMGRTPLNQIHWKFIRLALSSVADLCIIPMQDYLGLSSEARMNTPSTLGNNWKWRMLSGQAEGELADEIKRLSKLYSRR